MGKASGTGQRIMRPHSRTSREGPQWWRWCSRGALQAKALGLVDQVVERDQVLGAAEKVMQQLIRLPPLAVAGTKRVLREDFCRQWEQHWAGEAEGAWGFLNEPDTMRVLEAAMARLSGGNKGGAAGGGGGGGAADASASKL